MSQDGLILILLFVIVLALSGFKCEYTVTHPIDRAEQESLQEDKQG